MLLDDTSAEFHDFFQRRHAELARLASLLTGEADAADDLAADALIALWQHWDELLQADHPLAYARGVVANLARKRVRGAARERRRAALVRSRGPRQAQGPDVAAAVDVRAALDRLPFRERACVVLRHAFDLSERDTALALGISIGAVQSQTSKGLAELERVPGVRATGEGESLNEEITRQLHEAAEAHQPDHGRIRARVESGATGADVHRRTPGIARSWPRVALAGLAAAGILATGGLAITSVVDIAPTRPNSASAPPVQSPSSTYSTAGSAPLPTTATTDQPDRAKSSAPTPTSPADDQVSNRPLSAEGSIDAHSNDYWAQSNLVLDTAQPLTALTVELRIAQTGGVQTSGQWQTVPNDDFTITVQESGGALVYRWDLKPGRTVPAGQYTFAAQFNHAAGARDAQADSYDAQATAADGAQSVHGGFTPAG